MTTKEMYKNMLCRFINGMIVDAEYSIKEMSDIDYEGLCNIVRAYDKAIVTSASDTDNWQDLERMKVGAVKNVLL